MIVLGRAYCNLKVFRVERDGSMTLVREAHNMVLTSGLNQLRAAMLGTAWQLSAIGLGSSGTAVSGSQTWGLTPLMCVAPTDSYADGATYRATLRIMEDELVGETIREVWLAPTTEAPPAGPKAYARVVIPALAKTAEFAYVFQFDCSWSGNTKLACNMLAALANSQGAYSYELTGLLCGRGTTAPSPADTGLADPWTMAKLPLASSDATVDGQLTLYFTLPPDQYNGLTLAEVGLYLDLASGSSPVTVPLLYGRALIDPGPYAIEVGIGGQAVVILRWESA